MKSIHFEVVRFSTISVQHPGKPLSSFEDHPICKFLQLLTQVKDLRILNYIWGVQVSPCNYFVLLLDNDLHVISLQIWRRKPNVRYGWIRDPQPAGVHCDAVGRANPRWSLFSSMVGWAPTWSYPNGWQGCHKKLDLISKTAMIRDFSL